MNQLNKMKKNMKLYYNMQKKLEDNYQENLKRKFRVLKV